MIKRTLLLLLAFLTSNDLFAQAIKDGRYALINRNSSLALDVTAGSTANGAKLQQWGYAGSANQQFDLTHQGNGYYAIKAVHSAKMLDVAAASFDVGASILQYTWAKKANQLWYIAPIDTGYYTITAKHSGQAMEVWQKSKANGGEIRQYTLTNGTNQQWKFQSIAITSSSAPIVNGFAAMPGKNGIKTTTGGGNASPTVVTSCAALQSALTDSAARVIHIPANTTIDCRTAPRTQAACEVPCSGSGKFTYRVRVGTQTCTELGSKTNTPVNKQRNEISIHAKSNKTLLGLGSGSRILGANINIDSASNFIFRNFTLEDVNPHLVEAGGGIEMNNASHVWIDHVRFRLISDGYADMRNAKNVTLSWNHFDGYNPNTCDNHFSYTMFADDSTVTFHHNFFDRAAGRNPKLNKSQTRAHLYNNYWYDITYFATNTGNGAQAKIEGNYYENTSRPHWNESGLIDANMASNRYTGKSATDSYRHTGNSVFSDVQMYSYKLDNVDNLPKELRAKTGPQ